MEKITQIKEKAKQKKLEVEAQEVSKKEIQGKMQIELVNSKGEFIQRNPQEKHVMLLV